jgi:hypothetical protein
MSKVAEHFQNVNDYSNEDEADYYLHIWASVNVVCTAIKNRDLDRDDYKRLIHEIANANTIARASIAAEDEEVDL